MNNITVISVGKLKENFIKDGVEEYFKRLQRFCSIKLIEVEDEKAPEKLTLAQEEIVKLKEAERIKKYLKGDSFVFALDSAGKSHSSEEFAGLMLKLSVNGYSDLTFVIGGSIGLSYEILDNADYHLSFSKMTFPHQLMRVILLEQVYRGFKIIRGEPYHK